MRRRRRLISVSTLRTVTKWFFPQIRASSPSRLNTTPGWPANSVQEVKLLLGQLHAPVADEHVAPGRIEPDLSVRDRRRGHRVGRVCDPGDREARER